MIKKAVVLCGGLATRFLPISKSIPKEMLPVLDKPIMQIVIENLKQAGVEDVLLIMGRNKECIVNHFDKNIELEDRLKETNKLDYLNKVTNLNGLMNMYSLRQITPKGTGYAVKEAKNFVGDDPFILMFGDEVLFSTKDNVVEQLIKNYEKYHKTVIATQKVPKEEVYKYGIIDFSNDENGAYKVTNMVEKPKVDEAPSNVSYIGPAIITKDIYKHLDKMEPIGNKELVLTDAFRELAHDNGLMAQNIVGDRFDIGNKLGLVKVNLYAGLKDPEISKELKDYILMLAKTL